jgi:hypothetical protein
MAGFTFRLEHEDGTAADPPRSAPLYRVGGQAKRSRFAQGGLFGWLTFARALSPTRIRC